MQSRLCFSAESAEESILTSGESSKDRITNFSSSRRIVQGLKNINKNTIATSPMQITLQKRTFLVLGALEKPMIDLKIEGR